MKSITSSTLTLVAAIALVAVGVTGAFFADTETSSGNTFAAGVIDLMVGNESYYNGNACTNVSTDPQVEDWQWVGTVEYPEPGTACTVSWVDTTRSLVGKLFFAFGDLKPDDEGEDTISLTVDTNDAWACMAVSLTSDDDRSTTEPERDAGDVEEDAADVWDGELARNLQFIWWADDGDNVLEDDEYATHLLSDGVQTLYALATTSLFEVALADSATNVWTGTAGPLLAGQTYHIGKAWCFGTLTPAPVEQGQGVSPAVDPGITCDGTMIPDVNRIQTDGATLDVSFIAQQARHDSTYVCPSSYEPPVACELIQSYADEVVAINQGKRTNGTIVPLARSDTNSVLGPPHPTNTGDVDSGIPVGTFLSLGFATSSFTSAIGPSDGTASIVLAFNDNYVIDGPGIDLRLYEVTNGAYQDELVRVEVANTPTGPWSIAAASVSRNAGIDLSSVAVGGAWRYVRITDVSDSTIFPGDGDGYDLDAVQALNCIVSPVR